MHALAISIFECNLSKELHWMGLSRYTLLIASHFKPERRFSLCFIFLFVRVYRLAFTLTLLVRRQEEHPACKK